MSEKDLTEEVAGAIRNIVRERDMGDHELYMMGDKSDIAGLEASETIARAVLKRLNSLGLVQIVHRSDCAVNNGPALPLGPCNCRVLAGEGLHTCVAQCLAVFEMWISAAQGSEEVTNAELAGMTTAAIAKCKEQLGDSP